MSLTGDNAGLERLLIALGKVETGEVTDDIKRYCAPVLGTLIRQGFDASRSPTGARWRRLKEPRARGRSNRGGPLYDTGRLRVDASSVVVTPDGFAVHVSRPGVLVHEYGGNHVPMRRYLPVAPSLPATWQRHLDVVANNRFRSLFLGR